MALSEPAEFGHPDFILLDDITEEAFLENLKLRYEKGKVGQVYTTLMEATHIACNMNTECYLITKSVAIAASRKITKSNFGICC